jgi:hypothetical membrane protein
MVFSLGFVGLLLRSFEGGILAAVTVGLAAYITYLSSARITTQWLSNLLLAFVALGMLTAMATSTDQGWWRVHFSQLGTFDSFSSVVFNGTLMAGGLLVTTFAAYIQSDIRRLVARQRLRSERVATAIPVMFVIMGIMFAGVGVFPCDVYPVLHVISASGMAVVFLVLLISSRWLLVGMPRAFFLSELALGAALIAAVVLFVVGFFSLTGVEIGIFALIFGWITVFIRFLGVTGKEA